MLNRPWPQQVFRLLWLMLWGIWLLSGGWLLGGCQPRALQPPAERIVPSSGGVSDALNDYLLAEQAPRDTAYQVAYPDLDGDRIPEALVLLGGDSWCGLRGCPLLVFRGVSADQFIFISRIEPLRAPVLVSDRRSNGWRDLIVGTTVAGRPEDVRLTFGLGGYPGRAEGGEVVSGAGGLAGERVF